MLAVKLAKIAMPYNLFKTIKSFVSNRTYIVKADGIPTYHNFKTHSAVPQRSHCGPLLFILYCHDIVKCMDQTGVLMLQYADDTKFKIIENAHDSDQMQQAIDNLSAWSNINRLQLNSAKTCHILKTKQSN